MADATVSRLGQINGSGDVDALFLKKYAGEVLMSFEKSTVMMGRHIVRTIDNGKSAQFPVFGRKTAAYHTVGTEITGTAGKHAEKTIIIDDLLLADSFIANIDEAKNHYDVRSMYSMEDGRALAQQMDKHILQVGVLAARASATITGEPGGTIIEEAADGDFDTTAKLVTALFAAAQTMDENDVPEEDRYVFVNPARYNLLLNSDKLISRDFAAGNGDYAKGKIYEIAGMEIIKTNNLPTTNITTGVAAGTGTRYAGDFTTTKALVMHKSAIGTVKLMDLAMDAGYDMRRQGHLIISKYAMGHGILRPEAAIELQKFVL